MEAEADLINFGTRPTLRDDLEGLSTDEEIEDELKSLKSALIEKD